MPRRSRKKKGSGAKQAPPPPPPPPREDSSSSSDSESSSEEEERVVVNSTAPFHGSDQSDDSSSSSSSSSSEARQPPIDAGALLDSDSESSGSDSSEGSDDDRFAGDKPLSMQEAARLLQQADQQELLDAAQEMRDQIEHDTKGFRLPEAGEEEKVGVDGISYSELNQRIQDIVYVLQNFKRAREPGRSRSDYLDQLAKDCAAYYEYIPELARRFVDMFPPSECIEFMEANEKPRPVTIRVNTLRSRRKDVARALVSRGVSVDTVGEWSREGLVIYETPVTVGATPEYLAGQYMLQSAASMLPVLALGPKPFERVLDMCAAPGGKTTHIAQLMRNLGVLVANDPSRERLKALIGNCHRMGVSNVVVTNYDGRKLGRVAKFGRFDRILIDAPCSGLGVISRDPSIKVKRTDKDVARNSHIQKQLLLQAIDMLCVHGTSTLSKKTKAKQARRAKSEKGSAGGGDDGGVLVYSTCSISVEENEQVVDYALRKRFIKVVDTGLPFGTPGLTAFRASRFHPSLRLSRRFYPHKHNLDGFYVCKIIKLRDGERGGSSESDDEGAEDDDQSDQSEDADSSSEDDSGFESTLREQKLERKKARKARPLSKPSSEPVSAELEAVGKVFRKQYQRIRKEFPKLRPLLADYSSTDFNRKLAVIFYEWIRRKSARRSGNKAQLEQKMWVSDHMVHECAKALHLAPDYAIVKSKEKSEEVKAESPTEQEEALDDAEPVKKSKKKKHKKKTKSKKQQSPAAMAEVEGDGVVSPDGRSRRKKRGRDQAAEQSTEVATKSKPGRQKKRRTDTVAASPAPQEPKKSKKKSSRKKSKSKKSR